MHTFRVLKKQQKPRQAPSGFCVSPSSSTRLVACVVQEEWRVEARGLFTLPGSAAISRHQGEPGLSLSALLKRGGWAETAGAACHGHVEGRFP